MVASDVYCDCGNNVEKNDVGIIATGMNEGVDDDIELVISDCCCGKGKAETIELDNGVGGITCDGWVSNDDT